MSNSSSRRSIRGKILLRALAVSLIPLIILGVAVVALLDQLNGSVDESITSSQDELADGLVGQNLTGASSAIGRDLTGFLGERVDDIVQLAGQDSVVQAAIDGAVAAEERGLTELSINEVEAEFEATEQKSLDVSEAATRFLIQRRDGSDHFAEIFFTDENGFNVATSNPTSDFVQNDEIWWSEAWAKGAHLSEIEYDDSAGTFSMDVSVRIDDPETGDRLGVMKGVLDASVFQSVADTFRVSAQGDQHVTLYLSDRRLVAETRSDHAEHRLLNPDLNLTEEQIGFMDEMFASDQSSLVTASGVNFAGSTRLSSVLSSSLPDQELPIDVTIQVTQPTSSALAVLGPVDELGGQVDDSVRNTILTLAVVLAVAALGVWFVSRILARNVVTPITQLATQAHDVADVRLPATVAEVASGESENVPEVEPVLVESDDEVAELAEAFNSVQATAVDLAAEQAVSRRNISDLFVYLGRRNQNLIGRQLSLIESLERSEEDPELLEQLFSLDHVATRMRRNAESLLVLAGEESTRTWSKPVSVSNLVRAASAEVEDFTRVEIGAMEDATVRGDAVSDVAHLLAELIENALKYSPPQTPVQVAGRRIQDGYGLAVTDQGIGMQAEELVDVNQRLANPGDLERLPTSYLGLYVVARLAARHECRVQLVQGEHGGITAWIYLPPSLTSADAAGPEPMAPPPEAQPSEDQPAGSQPTEHLPAEDQPAEARPLDAPPVEAPVAEAAGASGVVDALPTAPETQADEPAVSIPEPRALDAAPEPPQEPEPVDAIELPGPPPTEPLHEESDFDEALPEPPAEDEIEPAVAGLDFGDITEAGAPMSDFVAEPFPEPPVPEQPEPVAEFVAEPLADLMPEPAPEPIAEPAAEFTPEPEPIAEPVAELTPEPGPEPLDEVLPEPALEMGDLPEPPTMEPVEALDASPPPPAPSGGGFGGLQGVARDGGRDEHTRPTGGFGGLDGDASTPRPPRLSAFAAPDAKPVAITSASL